MEAQATAVEDVTFFPQGGNDYKPGGVRVIKINLTSDQWLDPSTVKLFFTVKNNSSIAMRPKTPGGHVWFKRCRVLIAGQICEDIDNYNRVHQMFHILKPGERRINDNIEGFGSSSEATQTLDRTDITKANMVAANGQMPGSFTPLVGLFHQNKYLPIRYCPIQLELELVNTVTDAVWGSIVAPPEADGSSTFIIQDVQLKCDLVDLDDTLDNEYTQFLLDSSILPIHFTGLTSGSQIIKHF